MRTFTRSEIIAHFVGVKYSNCNGFVGFLVKNEILIKTPNGRYMYDFDKLSKSAVDSVVNQYEDTYFKHSKVI